MTPDHQTRRIGVQRQDVLFVMHRGHWRTFHEIQGMIQECYGRLHSEASISARLRDFRKARYGSYIVERRKRSEHLHEYRVLPPKPSMAEQIGMFQEASL